MHLWIVPHTWLPLFFGVRTPSYMENCIHFLSALWSIPNNEQSIRNSIAQYESSLKDMFERLDRQEESARAIDATDVTAWAAKYHAWWCCRHTIVHIQEVRLPRFELSSSNSHYFTDQAEYR